jgi:hypothetical protein
MDASKNFQRYRVEVARLAPYFHLGGGSSGAGGGAERGGGEGDVGEFGLTAMLVGCVGGCSWSYKCLFALTEDLYMCCVAR